MDNRLYHKARARRAPEAGEEARARAVAAKVEAERASRISMVRSDEAPSMALLA